MPQEKHVILQEENLLLMACHFQESWQTVQTKKSENCEIYIVEGDSPAALPNLQEAVQLRQSFRCVEKY